MQTTSGSTAGGCVHSKAHHGRPTTEPVDEVTDVPVIHRPTPAADAVHTGRLRRRTTTELPHTFDMGSAIHSEIDRPLRQNGGCITRSGHPAIARSIDHLVREGRLRPVLPGVYTVPTLWNDFGMRTRAVSCWAPDAVIVGRAAARLTFWPEVDCDRIELA